MNATFTHHYFLRMAHLDVLFSPIGQFQNKVSLTFAAAHRCLMI
jgi:hypothetical protein